MKSVVHIVGGKLNSGAARGAYWLHTELRNQGVESYLLVNDSGKHEDDNIIFLLNKKRYVFSNILIRMANLFVRKTLLRKVENIFSNGFFGYFLHKHPIVKKADIVNLHWINDGIVSLYSISKLNKTTFWTVRDMWPITGGCHYSMDCEQYLTKCGSCPVLNSRSSKDFSRFIFEYKKNIIKDNNIKAIAISNWVKDVVDRQGVFPQSVKVPNFIDNKSFYFDREIYSSSSFFRVLLGAQNINDFYKGFKDAIESINRLSLILEVPISVTTFGAVSDSLAMLFNDSVTINQVGFIDSNKLREIYNSSDVFLMPSHMETFGKTTLEALACGLPVVAYNSTGPKDIILHEYNGYLSSPYNSESLAEGLMWVYSNNTLELKLKCESDARKRFFAPAIGELYISEVLED
ncbi:glycosyltransferase [Vibrio antiquarius]|uniref:glycosyltransferase n=1 Tax=Vibrio antiquarius (strain Ex25) TaxID=150340 RepID=UPI00265D0DE0|nr:glycosyltransferase [Vibrio antiquarius]MCR9684644.1 glycosyltransferase [Vibrio antiquarius]